MNPLESLFASAIAGLAAGIVALWRQNAKLNADWRADQLEASRLIFALLQRLALYRGTEPQPTVSTPEKPQFEEAKKLAAEEVNGEIESLLKNYLASSYPPRKTKP
jgi:hypothetical protein